MLKTIKLAAASATIVAGIAAGVTGAAASSPIAQETVRAETTVNVGVKARRLVHVPRCHRRVRVRSVGYSKIRIHFQGHRFVRFLRYKPKRVITYRRLPPYRLCVGGWYIFSAWKGLFKYRIITHAYTGRIVHKRIIGRRHPLFPKTS